MTNSQNKQPANTYSGRNFKCSGMYFSTINNFLQIQCPNFVFKVKKGKKREVLQPQVILFGLMCWYLGD